MHVGVVQANTRLQASLLLALRRMRSSTMGASTGRWTARRRLILAPNVKATISLCPRAGRCQPTMPIHYSSSDRSAGEQESWLLQMEMDTTLLPKELMPGFTGILPGFSGILPCLRLGQRTRSSTAADAITAIF
jgi:hypothetical protein